MSYMLGVDGEVRLLGRYSARVGCDLNFKYFPFDRQKCPFKMYIGKTFSPTSTV